MQNTNDPTKLAQSASALGAAILGFGLGMKFGSYITAYSLIIILVGAIIHVAGMYVVQMKDNTAAAGKAARFLLATAWICLIALLAIILFLIFSK